MQLFVHPGQLDGSLIGHKLAVSLVTRGQRLVNTFGGQHAGLDRGVRALDLGAIEEPGIAADEHAAGKAELRQRLQAALVHGARAIGDALAALEIRSDLRVLFPALKFLEWRQVRVAVVQRQDDAEKHLRPGRVVEKPAALRVLIQRPPQRVHDEPCIVLVRIDLPDFLEADAVMLRIRAGPEVEPVHELLTEAAMTALRENRVLPQQLVARLVSRLALPAFADALVAGRNAGHPATPVVQYFAGREARKHIDAHRLRLFCEPLAKPSKANDEIALVVHRARQEQRRHANRFRFTCQVMNKVTFHFGMHGSVFFTPVREQLVQCGRLKDVTRQDMGADFRTFFHDDHGKAGIKLHEPAGRGQPCRPAANDDDVEFHRLTFDRLCHVVFRSCIFIAITF